MMTHSDIATMLKVWEPNRERTIVIVDYGNVEKWKNSLRWKVGMRPLAQFAKYFASGVNSQSRRRFYYGADYGKNEKSLVLTEWSRSKLEMAQWNNFEVIKKRVKYIHSADNVNGFEKKCDLDVEMTVDLIRLRATYDHLVLFSGDGDLVYAIRYLKELGLVSCIVFGARDHIGREIIDAKNEDIIDRVCFAQDFEYRLQDRYGR